ncbi:hypothetical protein [Bacteroides sp. L10-4]|uniref:hypothetical protein n=1 Tax=Bacteroides sp. L10-4 TaxID=2746063 RepID=UPI00159572E3|nr:hypothetical protein [Bacteroides sp. L10-4]NVK92157.1 hypothetical protein [Bacteroides sp. L10-4]
MNNAGVKAGKRPGKSFRFVERLAPKSPVGEKKLPYLCNVVKLNTQNTKLFKSNTFRIMPVLYKTIQSTKENKDGAKLFHPRVVHTAI